MNQAFIGSVFWNLPYFKNDGVFGSRFYGGKDRGSIKSIKTELNKKIVIFMLSSSVNPINIERARKISEITDYVTKPIKLEEVKRVFDTSETLL